MRRSTTFLSAAFDLIVLGSGPAGQKCAIDSAKRGKRVAVVDKISNMGGVCVHTGTIPSKTLREAIIGLTGYRSRANGTGIMHRIEAEDIIQQVRSVERKHTNLVKNQLQRNNITCLYGFGKLAGPGAVDVLGEDGTVEHHTAEKIMISVGTAVNHGKGLAFESKQIYDCDEILDEKELVVPRSMIVVGGGVIGMEYASMFNIIPGTKVTVVDGASQLLPFCDTDVVDMLLNSFRQDGGRIVLNDTLEEVKQDGQNRVHATLKSGKTLVADCLLYALGRQARTAELNLTSIGATPKKRGHLVVNEHYQVLRSETDSTVIGNVYAAGDVIGIPALASTSMEQGRRASCHMWGDDSFYNSISCDHSLFPYGIYTVPEISCCGRTEQELSKAGIRYEVGLARYGELARSHLVGDVVGMLKILFCPSSLKLFGVHCIGEGATEIVHIGQVVLAHHGTLDYFRNTVFNYPTFAEAYRVAALDGLSKAQKHMMCQL